MNDQRMVDVGLLRRFQTRFLNLHHAMFGLQTGKPGDDALKEELADIIDGTGVEPAMRVVRNDTGQIRLVNSSGGAFDMSKHVGDSFYLAAPSAPVQGLPEGCAWAVTKGGHSICQPPKSWYSKKAPVQASDDELIKLANFNCIGNNYSTGTEAMQVQWVFDLEALRNMMRSAPVQAVPDEVTKRPDALARDSTRWDAIETLMWLGEVTMTHREDGGYGILLEPAESIKPQEWVGDDPGAAVDAVIARLAQPPKAVCSKCNSPSLCEDNGKACEGKQPPKVCKTLDGMVLIPLPVTTQPPKEIGE